MPSSVSFQDKSTQLDRDFFYMLEPTAKPKKWAHSPTKLTDSNQTNQDKMPGVYTCSFSIPSGA